jgi:hypothetical protein
LSSVQFKRSYHPSRDQHLAVHKIVQECGAIANSTGNCSTDRHSLAQYCWDKRIHFNTIKFVVDLAASFSDYRYLGNTGMPDSVKDGVNDHVENLALAALAAGFGTSRLSGVRHGELSKGYVDPSAITIRTE